MIKYTLFLLYFLFATPLHAERQYCKYFGEYSYAPHINAKSWNEGACYSVGKFCSIADNLTIYLGGNHRTEWLTTYPFPYFKDVFPEVAHIDGNAVTKGNVTIKNDVWIGSNVTILSGVTIGDGVIIGANSVVAKSIPPYAIVVGNPAKIVRYRFDEKMIECLLKIAWWDWPIEKIRANLYLLCSENIEEFISLNS